MVFFTCLSLDGKIFMTPHVRILVNEVDVVNQIDEDKREREKTNLKLRFELRLET